MRPRKLGFGAKFLFRFVLFLFQTKTDVHLLSTYTRYSVAGREKGVGKREDRREQRKGGKEDRNDCLGSFPVVILWRVFFSSLLFYLILAILACHFLLESCFPSRPARPGKPVRPASHASQPRNCLPVPACLPLDKGNEGSEGQAISVKLLRSLRVIRSKGRD